MKGKLERFCWHQQWSRGSYRAAEHPPSLKVLVYHAGNAVCLIVRHLAMLREEHCFTTNGLAPVNHRATIRRAQFTRVRSRHRFSRPTKRSRRSRKLRATCLKTCTCTCPSAAFSRKRSREKVSRSYRSGYTSEMSKWTEKHSLNHPTNSAVFSCESSSK